MNRHQEVFLQKYGRSSYITVANNRPLTERLNMPPTMRSIPLRSLFTAILLAEEIGDALNLSEASRREYYGTKGLKLIINKLCDLLHKWIIDEEPAGPA